MYLGGGHIVDVDVVCVGPHSYSCLSSSFIRLAQTMSHKFGLPHPIAPHDSAQQDQPGASEIALHVLFDWVTRGHLDLRSSCNHAFQNGTSLRVRYKPIRY